MKTLGYGFLILALLLVADHDAQATSQVTMSISTKNSLVRLGATPLEITEAGTSAATLALEAITHNDKQKAMAAIKKYDTLIPKENIGGDYLGLKWLIEALFIAPKKREGRLTSNMAKEYYTYFTANDNANLKEYLQRKYKLKEFKDKNSHASIKRCTYLEDMIMFNNPWRNKWEKSDAILANVPLDSGDTLLDIGAGFGYYTYQFADIVGQTGRVYAIDTSKEYIEHIKGVKKKYGYDNIEPVLSKTNDISVNDQADVAFMSSLYHVIYTWSSERDRQPFLLSIKRALKPGGYLIIADNNFADGNELHNCYVHKELIQQQLHFYDFQLVKTVEISPLRYVMVFKNQPGELDQISISTPNSSLAASEVKVHSTNSLVHIGSLDSYDITKQGITAAKVVLEALETKDIDTAQKAIDMYHLMIPTENFGGEYTSLQWFCKYLATSTENRKKMLADPLTAAYFDFLGKDDFKILKSYLKYKYKLIEQRPLNAMEAKDDNSEEDREIGRTRRAFVEDFILFNNPKREEWENSPKILSLLPFKEGDKVLDIGSGSGFYSYRFSQLVGKEGRVYAADIKDNHIQFIKNFCEKEGISNIEPVNNKINSLKIKEKVDYAFMCSLYHNIYGVSSQQERELFINDIKNSLKKNGVLFLVDNGPVKNELLPYHGPYIAKELIIAQLAHYGFEFEEYHQIIPQRYMLRFRLTE